MSNRNIPATLNGVAIRRRAATPWFLVSGICGLVGILIEVIQHLG
jgi:hypothetical protein